MSGTCYLLRQTRLPSIIISSDFDHLMEELDLFILFVFDVGTFMNSIQIFVPCVVINCIQNIMTLGHQITIWAIYACRGATTIIVTMYWKLRFEGRLYHTAILPLISLNIFAWTCWLYSNLLVINLLILTLLRLFWI